MGDIIIVQTGQKHTGKGDQSGKEELFWQAKEQIIFQWFCFSVERFERHYKLQDTIPQHSGESTTSRWFLMSFTVDLEKHPTPVLNTSPHNH